MADEKVLMYRDGGGSSAILSAYPPNPCSNLVAKPGNAQVKLTWDDPDDLVLTNGTTIAWAKTVIVRKTGSYPSDEEDGVTVVSSTVKNQYSSTPYVDSGLTNDTTYYYRAFAISEDGAVNRELVQSSATPVSYKTMTVSINFGNSSPTGMCTLSGDAAGLATGFNSSATAVWKEFFGYRPCLFKDGAVVGYLNPDNYAQFEDGSSADITSGNSGDVMIEYPRRGVKMSKSGNVVTISVTDNPDASGFTYYAHTRGTTRRDAFYLGAYLGYVTSSKLRSLSGKTNTNSTTLSSYRTYAGNLGSGYTPMTYYQYLYIQIMYCFQFSNNLDSQSVLGWGKYNNGTYTCSSGTGNTKGVVFGTPGTTGELKLFGLENPWGVAYQLIDGYYTNSSGAILTATDGFNNSGSGYTSRQTGRSGANGWISNVEGTSELGFTPTSSGFNGSSSTYLCDYAYLYFGGCVPGVWGDGSSGTYFGVFCFSCDCNPSSSSSSNTGSRLAY